MIQASQRKFNDKNIYMVQGYALIQLNRLVEAETSFSEALRMYPKLLLPRLWLAELYYQQGRIAAAIAQWQQILVIEPKIVTEATQRIKSDAKARLSQLVNIIPP